MRGLIYPQRPAGIGLSGGSRLLSVITLGLALATPMAGEAHAEHRVALVIGNGAYRNVAHLINPTNDAKLIANALTHDGFVVSEIDDANRDGLVTALRSFAHEADDADWAVIYYAGHGIEMGGTNYLIPVDAKLETDRDVGLEAIPLDQVMSAIEGARGIRLVILDACRNNPFATTMKRTAGSGRDVGRGLGRVEPAQATLVAYSAKDGSIARDGEGADSPYASALAKHLTEPGVEVDKLFRLVRDDVQDATGKNQEPFVYGSLPGHQDFFFAPPAETNQTQDVSSREPIPPPLPPKQDVYFVERNGKSLGPLTIDQVKQEIANHGIEPGTLIWRPGDAGWRPAKEVVEIEPLLAALPPPLPSPTRDWNKFVLGTWQWTATPSAGVTQNFVVQYRADGTVVGVVRQAIRGVQGGPQAFAGTWTAQPTSSERFTFVLAILGQAPSTSVLRRIDDNTVTDDKGLVAHRTGS
jgi:hypothetical protein